MSLRERIKNIFLEAFYSVSDVKDAFNTLGLQVGDYEGVKKAYREMSMKYHPDKGGSEEQMKKINNAKQVIDNAPKISKEAGFSREDQQKMQAEKNVERYAKAKVVTDFIFAKIDPLMKQAEKDFLAYLKDVFGFEFTVEHTSKKADNQASNKGWYYNDMHAFDGHAKWQFKFKPVDESSSLYLALDLEGTIYERDFDKALSVKDLDITLSYETYAYNSGKKTKMQQRTWGLKKNSSALGTPEEFFPKKQLLKMTGSALTRKTKRADAFAFMTREMKATYPFTDKDLAVIELGGDNVLYVRRNVMMGTAAWTFEDIKKREGQYKFVPSKDYDVERLGAGDKSLFRRMGAGKTGSTVLIEANPQFGEIVKKVTALIKDKKFEQAGELIQNANQSFEGSEK